MYRSAWLRGKGRRGSACEWGGGGQRRGRGRRLAYLVSTRKRRGEEGKGRKGRRRGVWRKHNVPATSAYVALQNWVDQGVDRTSYLLRATDFLSPPPIPVAHLRRSPFAKEDDPRPHPLHHVPRGWDAHEGTRHRLLPLSPVPPPWPRHHARKGRQGHAAPPLPPSTAPLCTRGKGAREGAPPPPHPCHSRGRGCMRARRPVRAGRGTRHPVTTGPFPSPFDCAAVYARERGAQGLATPGPTFPIRAEGARTRGTPPRYLPTVPPCTRRKGARMGKRPPAHPSHSRGRGAHEGHEYAWTAACEGKLPHPVPPHSRGKGRTRPLASLCVAQQGRRGLHAPAFTAPAPRFRAPLYDLDKKK
ncbi:hypothetical protein EDB83DRAFT_2309550 [Lactarius deliciosus]|nr:hypothetical protein EDB83DRAFT_2309550 [Lactarius deliciosus]